MNPTLAGLTAVFVWGASALFITFLARIPALEIVSLTWIISGICMTLWFTAKGVNIIEYFRRPPRDYMLVAGGMGVYTALFYIGFKYAPPFEAHILNYLWPIFLMLFLILSRRTPVTPVKIIGMLMGFAGCVLISATHDGGAAFSGFGAGHIIMIAAAAIWALYSCFTRGTTYPIGFMIPVFLVCAVFTAALHFIFEPTIIPGAQEWVFIGLIGLCRLAYALWDYGMRFGNQALITSASYFTPLLSTIVLAAGGYGAATPAIAVSAALIISGCIIGNGDQLKKLFAARS